MSPGSKNDTVPPKGQSGFVRCLEEPLQIRHPDLSFDDGNIAICTGQYYFLVHQGLLCYHSEFFADLTQSLGGSNLKMLQGRPVIDLPDSPDDMYYFLRALYDGILEPQDNFELMLLILRMATKYRTRRLKAALTEIISTAWPSTLKQWDEREHTSTPSANFPHPILVINIARAINEPKLLPAAFYDLSRYPPSQIVAGASSVLSATRSELSCEDVLVALKGRENAARFFSTFVVSKLEGRNASPGCNYRNAVAQDIRKNCRAAFENMTFELLRDIICKRNSDPLYAIHESLGTQSRDDVPAEENIHSLRTCDTCSRTLASDIEESRRDFWMKLPDWFGVDVAHWG